MSSSFRSYSVRSITGAGSSLASSISDCKVNFGGKSIKDNKSVKLPEIKKLENFSDFLTIRAEADSEALRLRFSDTDIFDKYKPKGQKASKLYQIV